LALLSIGIRNAAQRTWILCWSEVLGKAAAYVKVSFLNVRALQVVEVIALACTVIGVDRRFSSY